MKKIIISLFFFSILTTMYAQNMRESLLSGEGKDLKMKYSTMALSAELIGTALSDPDWYNWCVSPIATDDGKVHVFTSRWPASEGMNGWMGHNAEIAHFVGERPEGPFKYVRTVLKGSDFPDPSSMWGAHNSRVSFVDGKYVLHYIVQTSKQDVVMAVGMMIADNINGPWHFVGDNDGLVISKSTDANHWTHNSKIGTDNPTFLKVGDKYHIYFKAGPAIQRQAKYGVAVSDKLEGPYIMSDGPITDNIDYIEDAVAFEANGNYYLLSTDNYGTNTGVFGDLILWKSKDGLSFKLKDAKIGMGTMFDYWGTTNDHKQLLDIPDLFQYSTSSKLERPAILKVEGVPAYLYCPAGVNINGGKTAESYVFKIKWNEAD